MLVIILDHLNAKLPLSLLGRRRGVQEEQPTGRLAAGPLFPAASSSPHDSPTRRTDERTRPPSNPIPVQGTEHQDPPALQPPNTLPHTLVNPNTLPYMAADLCPVWAQMKDPPTPSGPTSPTPLSGVADLAWEPLISLALACLASCVSL